MQKTQTSDILQHLKDGRKLTQKEAINEYGAYRLSGIIHRLRKQGYNITSIPTEVPTRYKKSDGTRKMSNIVEYKLVWTDLAGKQHILRENSVEEHDIKDKTSFDSRLKSFIDSIINN